MERVNMFCKVIQICVLFCLTTEIIVSAENVMYFEKAEPKSYDKNYFSSLVVETQKIDDTTISFSSTAVQIVDIIDMKVRLKADVIADGKSMPTELDLEMYACEYFEDEDLNIFAEIGTDGVHGNWPKKCSENNMIPKNTYFIKDVTSIKPPMAYPPGRYTVYVQYVHNDKVIVDYVWQVSIVPK